MSDGMLAVHPVFTALTRPAMTMGVTLDYMMINFMLTLCLMILINHPGYLLIFLPLHAVGWMICKYDPNIFRIIMAVLACDQLPNRTIWGCRSYEPY